MREGRLRETFVGDEGCTKGTPEASFDASSPSPFVASPLPSMPACPHSLLPEASPLSFGNFKDVRFHPILSFGLFLGRPLKDVRVTTPENFVNFGRPPLFQLLKKFFGRGGGPEC